MLMLCCYCFFSGQIVICDEERDCAFAKRLQNVTNAKHSRWEAFTFVRICICTVDEADNSSQAKVNLTATHKRLNGANDTRISCKHTGIYSFLCT